MNALWQRPLLVPLTLVLLGLLLLATNLGWISADFWRTVAPFWPLILVLLGVELLVTGRASWGAALLLILVFILASSLADGRPFGARFGGPSQPPAGGRVASIDQPLGGAREAEVILNFGAGRLLVGSGAADGFMIQGTTDAGGSEAIRAAYRVLDGVGRLELNVGPRGPGAFLFANRRATDASFRLSPKVSIRRLVVTTGAAELDLDLRDLQLLSLDLETGASQVKVQLPARGIFDTSIQGGASSVVVQIPPNVATTIRVEGGVSQVSVDQTRFPSTRSEGMPGLGFRAEYRSANFDSAADRATVRIQAGASRVRVE